jgi:hypothetical protein
MELNAGEGRRKPRERERETQPNHEKTKRLDTLERIYKTKIAN